MHRYKCDNRDETPEEDSSSESKCSNCNGYYCGDNGCINKEDSDAESESEEEKEHEKEKENKEEMRIKWKNDAYDAFERNLTKAGYKVEEYHGRYAFHGPAVRVGAYSFDEVQRKSKVRCQRDDMGRGIIVYPK